jgi:hypothetical protein
MASPTPGISVNPSFSINRCAYRKSKPDILVVQPADNWAAKNLPGPFDGTREQRILLQGEKDCFLGAVRRRTMICCRNVKISASIADRERNRSTTAHTMSLTRSLITDQHRPILGQPAADRFATGTGEPDAKQERSYGRSQTSLYNYDRTHRSLDKGCAVQPTPTCSHLPARKLPVKVTSSS